MNLAPTGRGVSPERPSATAIARARLIRRLVLVVVVSTVTACGSGARGPDQRTFERRMMERERITAEQAACVSRIIFETYRSDEIRQIYDDGVSVLPSMSWTAYVRALFQCVLSDELAGPSGPGPGTPPTTGSGP